MNNNTAGRAFSDKEKTALCVMCSLAECMKDCSNCRFKVGRAVRAIHHATLALGDDPVAVEQMWQEIPAELWGQYYDYAYSDHDAQQIFWMERKEAGISLEEERKAEAMAGCNR